MSSSPHLLSAPAATLGSDLKPSKPKHGVFYVIRHPTQITQYFLESVAGRTWKQFKAHTRLFPLKFRSSELEYKYQESANARFKLRVPIASAFLFMGSLLMWVVVGIGFSKDWIRGDLVKAERLWHITSAVGTSVSAFSFCVPLIKGISRYTELAFYMCLWINVYCYLRFGNRGIKYAAEKFDPIDETLTGQLNLEYFAEFKMVADGVCNTALVATLVNIDIFLNSSTKKSLWFHLLVYLTFIYGRLMQNKYIPFREIRMTNRIDCVMAAFLYTFGWTARWFREAQDRAVELQVRESHSRLKRVREAQRQKQRRRDQSAAEELLDVVTTTKQNIAQSKENILRNSRTECKELSEADQFLSDALRILSGGAKRLTRRQRRSDDTVDALEEENYLDQWTRLDRASSVEETLARQQPPPDLKAINESFSSEGKEVRPLELFEQYSRSIGVDWDLDVFALKKQTGCLTAEVGYVLLRPYINYLNTNEKVVLCFCTVLERLHWDGNPFHNSAHAAMTAHCSASLVRILALEEILSNEDFVALAVAALCHDLAHPGYTNNFYIQANSLSSLVHNDHSVIECAHCSVLQNVLACTYDVNLLIGLPPADYLRLRRHIVELILITDMAAHFDFLSKVRIRRSAQDWDYAKNDYDKAVVLQLIIKMADLACWCVDWSQHQEWAFRVQEEFFQQGDCETLMGMPVSPLCDRANHPAIGRMNYVFINHVVVPLIDQLVSLDKQDLVQMTLLHKAKANAQKWEDTDQFTIPDHIRQACQIAHPQWLTLVTVHTLRAVSFADLMKPIHHG